MLKLSYTALASLLSAPLASASLYRGKVTVANRAPMMGTCQTPVWVGIHGGDFDTYDRNQPLRESVERLVEDGNNAPLVADFAASDDGVWDGTVGTAPICPGESAELPFEIYVEAGTPLYFSYASMILPSNDAFVANGNPKAFLVFDDDATFVPVTVNSLGSMVLDGGTEVNDELPENTAFFGQMTPNTGYDEGGVVETHPGFLPASEGGILADPRFVNADFTVDGYAAMDIEVVAEEVPPCEIEYVLFNAETDEEVGLLDRKVCIPDYEINIEARPSKGCSEVESAFMDLAGPIHDDRIENVGPYFMFGDRPGRNIFGRNLRPGKYTIRSELFSKNGRRGDLVVEREFEFVASRMRSCRV